MAKPIIICVDDEKIVLTSLKSELKAAFGGEYMIETAEGGEDALEVINEILEDGYELPLVISDYIMPDIKGDELLKRVHELSPTTLKIMLTGQADTAAVGNAVNYAKLYRYIAKPWEAKDLALTVTEAVRSYFQAQQIEAQNMQLRELNKNLERKVVERTRELSEALEDLKSAQGHLIQSEKMAALGKITAGVAHEVNNPIGAVNSAADLCLRCIEKVQEAIDASGSIESLQADRRLQNSLEILSESGQTIKDAGARIVTIVDSLQNFARLDEAEFQYAHIHSGIESTLTLLQSDIPENVTIEKEFGDLPEIQCFPGDLNQLFMTLLSDALEALPEGGKIAIKTSAGKNQIKISISDTGKGIPPERIDSLFEFDFHTKDSRVGLEVGLPNVYAIVKKHQGDIRVNSEINLGTEFIIDLPISPSR